MSRHPIAGGLGALLRALAHLVHAVAGWIESRTPATLPGTRTGPHEGRSEGVTHPVLHVVEDPLVLALRKLGLPASLAAQAGEGDTAVRLQRALAAHARRSA